MCFTRNETGVNSNTKYEIEAFAFHYMTGKMAPGKDSPAAAGGDDYVEREQAWKRWKDEHGKCVQAMLAAFAYITQ